MRRATAILLTLICAFQTTSCTSGPPPPCPWFTEHFKSMQYDLPQGVGITLLSNNQKIVFYNTTSIDLYLIGKIPYNFITAHDKLPVELPDGTGPVYRIVNSTNYRWTTQYDEQTSSMHYFWEVDEYSGNNIRVYINEITIDHGGITLLDLAPYNLIDEPKPGVPEIPASQHVFLPIVYDNQLIQVPITIYYLLNNDVCYIDDSSELDYLPIILISLFLCFIVSLVMAGSIVIIIKKFIKREVD